MTLTSKAEHERDQEFENRSDLHRCDKCGTVISETAAKTEYVEGLWFCDEYCKEFFVEEGGDL